MSSLSWLVVGVRLLLSGDIVGWSQRSSCVMFMLEVMKVEFLEVWLLRLEQNVLKYTRSLLALL